jgi:hypothetical protein
MSNVEKGQIDQLWYTWSTRGLDTIPAGFRMRAASSGLTDIYGKRVEQLSRYLRYSLPPGTDVLNTLPESAPVCLAYVCTEDGERALVHKVYTGRDGRNRPGAYFAHMLVGLDDFTPRNAIALWNSPFWERADSAKSTQLNHTSLQTIEHEYGLRPLEVQFQDTARLAQQFRGIFVKLPDGSVAENGASGLHDYLCFVVRAYLLQRHRLDEQRQQLQLDLLLLQKELKSTRERALWNRPGRSLKDIELDIDKKEAELRSLQPARIVIAAPPDTVAYLIAALIRVMPDHFLKNITFSTYEHDVQTRYPLDIVGTCLPPIIHNRSHKPQDILPAAIYKTNLALNTYQSSQSMLADIKLADERIPAGLSVLQYYADDAAGAVESNDWQELDEFLEEGVAEKVKELEQKQFTVSDFLQLYYFSVIVVRWLSLKALSDIFDDLELAKAMLKKHRVRTQIFHRIYRDDPQLDVVEREKRETRDEHLYWLAEVLPSQAAKMQELSSPKNALVSRKNVELVKENLDRVADDSVQHLTNRAELDDCDFFCATHNLLHALSPLHKGAQIWINLLQRFREDKLLRFALQHWKARDLLLEDACGVLTPGEHEHDQIVYPLLIVTSAADFGRLLAPAQQAAGPYSPAYPALRLPAKWNYKVVFYFLDAVHKSQKSGEPILIVQTVTQLELYRSQLEQLTEHLYMTGRSEYKTVAQDLFKELVDYGYRYRLHLLYAWLNLQLSANELIAILQIAKLKKDEIQLVLKDYSAIYLQRDDTAHVFEKLLESIAGQLSSEKKLEVIDSTLEDILSKEQSEVRS